MRYMIQPSTIQVLIGRSAQELPLTGHFTIIGQPLDATKQKNFFSEVTAT
jgi:hypothetical protein